MKLKTYFNAALLCLAASLFAACAGDNLADNNNKENKQEIPQGVRFTINEPKANAKARVVINEDGTVAAKTRTFITHTPGMGADAFWSDNDYIWVKNNAGVWKKSIYTAITTPDKKHAMFILPGKLSDYSDGCSVIYNMSQPASSPLANNPEYLNIANLQPQNRANDFSDAGAWGDAGIGKAKLTDAPGEFVFQLAHGVSYLCLLPRCENAALGQNVILKKVQVMGDHYLTATFCNFAADGSVYIPSTPPTGVPSAMYGNIDSDVANFPLTNTTQDITKNGCYFIIVPGTYNFTITYTLKDKVTGMEGDVVKHVNGVVCNPGEINDLSANVTPPTMTAKYYSWDVDEVDDCWHGYESEQPVISQELPGATDSEHGPMNENSTPYGYPYHNGDARASRWAPGEFTDVAYPFFKANVPNSNELLWYAAKGDPHWDGRRAWALKDHLYAGGMWFKKRAKICADEHITEADMKSKFKVEAPNESEYLLGQDVSHQSDKGGYMNTSASISQPVPNQTDYFFLPAAGYYRPIPDKPYDPSHPFRVWTGLFHAGQAGYYWSRSIDYTAAAGIHDFYFSEGVVIVDMNGLNATQAAAMRYPLTYYFRDISCLPVIKFQ
ncbi:MAG: hypothetical protein ACFNLP_06945 [Segatella oulorum]